MRTGNLADLAQALIGRLLETNCTPEEAALLRPAVGTVAKAITPSRFIVGTVAEAIKTAQNARVTPL